LQDIRRMNVGLTRAKSSLWVLGNSESLMRENSGPNLSLTRGAGLVLQGNYVGDLKPACACRYSYVMSDGNMAAHLRKE